MHGPGYLAGADLWRKRRLLGWLVHQSYKLQWEEHKEAGQEHRCTLTIQLNIMMMKWNLGLIPPYEVVVRMVKMFAVHTCFFSFSKVASTILEVNRTKSVPFPLKGYSHKAWVEN